LAGGALLMAIGRLWGGRQPGAAEHPRMPGFTLLGACWLALAFYGAALSPHFLPHYMAPLLPPLLLLSGRLLHEMTWEWGLRRTIGARASVALLMAICSAWAAMAAYRQFEIDSRLAWERKASWENGQISLNQTAWQAVGGRLRELAQPG